MKILDAIMKPNGEVRLLEPVNFPVKRRVLVTILDDESTEIESALLSEAALAEDWDRTEEDAARAHLKLE